MTLVSNDESKDKLGNHEYREKLGSDPHIPQHMAKLNFFPILFKKMLKIPCWHFKMKIGGFKCKLCFLENKLICTKPWYFVLMITDTILFQKYYYGL